MRYFILGFAALFMFCAPAFAADSLKSLEAELQKLEAELPDVLQDETSLDAREKYVDRVLKLRAKIEALAETADTQTDENQAESNRVLYFKGFYLYESGKGYVPHPYAGKIVGVCSYNKCGENVDYRVRTTVENYPQTIKPGESFSITVATKKRMVKHAGMMLGEWSKSLNVTSAALTEFNGYDGPWVKVGNGFEGKLADYTYDYRGAFEVDAQSSVTVDFVYAGYDKETPTVGTYDYKVAGIKKDGTLIGRDPTGEIQHMDYNEREEKKGDESHQYGFKFTVNGLTAVYDWGTKDDQPASAKALPEGEPLTARQSAPEGEGNAETAGETHGKEDGQNETASVADASGRSTNPALNDPDKREKHIKYWLKNAEPMENAKPGYFLKYEKWGRIEGKAPGGKIVVSGKPDDAGGFFADPYEYVWGKAETLQSHNLCTLHEYVSRKLSGQETDSCDMHVYEQDPYGHGAAAKGPVTAVPDYVGQPATQAKSGLEALGVQVKWQAGSVPEQAGKAGTVERQNPAAGTALEKTDTVELWVYRAATKTVSVPHVVGLTYDVAVSKLRSEGLEAHIGMTFTPESAEEAGKVISQQTKAGSKVAGGTAVILDIAQGNAKVPMPAIIGMPYEQAERKMKAVGLKPLYKMGPYASRPEQAGTVADIDLVPSGQMLPLGAVVTVTAYNTYSEKTAPKTQPEKIVKADPSTAFGGATVTPASGVFQCDTGMGHIPVENAGRLYPKRRNGVVETDANGMKNYICRYNMKGKSRVAEIAFFDSEPASAEGRAFKQRVCGPNAMYKGLNRGKALVVYLATGISFGNIGNNAQVEQFINFHVNQIEPHAVSCSGGGQGKTNTARQQTDAGGKMPKFMNCNITVAGLAPLTSGGPNAHRKWGQTLQSDNGRDEYSCRYKNARGDLVTVGATLLTQISGKTEAYQLKKHCTPSTPDDKGGVGMYGARTNGKAVSVSINQWSASKKWTSKFLSEADLQKFINFHTGQLSSYAANCP